MPGRLAGKVAIVTGAGSSGPGVGTGKAISIVFAREGARVILVDRDLARARETLAQIRQEGGDAIEVVADVTSPDDCRRAVEAALAHAGRLDTLVNNVGIVAGGGVAEVSDEQWHQVLQANLTSAMSMSRQAVPAMIRGGGGAIVNIGSIAALRGGGSAAYAASKAGLIGLTLDTAAQYGAQGVRANYIAPGHLHTPMVAEMPAGMRELRRRIGPLETEGTAWDVAWAALFLASDEARWITGAILPVDAGTLAAMPLTRVTRVGAPPA
jgi:NAD(P)-dependent dehydrogenase (short-subunit alcohol dehydrogenase family)